MNETRVCANIGVCGGCKYGELSYEEQLAKKEATLRELFIPVIGGEGFEAVFDGITPAPAQWEYRNKMELSFGDCKKGGELMLGLHRKKSRYDIIDASGCMLMDADMRAVAEVTQRYFRGQGTQYFHKRTHEGYLRHLLLRKAYYTGELLVDLVTCPVAGGEVYSSNNNAREHTAAAYGGLTANEERRLLDGWRDAVLALVDDGRLNGSIAGILHTRNDRIADVVEDGGTDVLYGEAYFTERLLGLSFKITPFSFFQTNSRGAEVLYSRAREYLLGNDSLSGKTVYDLYSGTGTIAQILSPAAGRVIGVELVPEAVEAARENAERNNITNCAFLAGDVLKVLDTIEERPDVLVLDPPRDGIHPKALPKLLDYGVNEILYIACKPASLARDLPAFFDAGYHIARFSSIDLFPNTNNQEGICLLAK